MLPVFTAAADGYGDADTAALLSELNIMSGDPDGNLRLDDYVTRAEFSKIAVAASSYRNSVASSSAVSPFKDVPYSHWAAPYVKIAVTNGIVTGYPDATFRPDNYVTYEEAVTVCLKLLGYTSEDFGVSWPYGQTGMAANLKLNSGVSAAVGGNMSRRDVMTLVYNMLNTQPKSSNQDYISIFGYTIVEDCILIASSEEDSSVGSGKVSTSEGVYSVSDSFNKDYIGRKGDMVLKDNKELVIFIPSQQQVNTYNIYQVLDNDLVVYENGVPSNANIDTSMTVYNKSNKTTLSAMMGSITAGDVLVTYKNEQGVLDYGIIKTDTLKGPYIAYSNDWYKDAGINPEGYSVTRDGVRASLSDIKTYDVVYCSPALKTVWAYSKKVTGIYESASPNKDLPTSVVVSGVTYKLEGVDAYNKLSSSGSFNYGDTVTLLLGRNGDAAGVMPASAAAESVSGYLQKTGTKQFVTSDGNAVSSYYVNIVKADGSSADYRTAYDYEGFLNNIVTLSFNGDGVATVAAKSRPTTVYGTVDAKNCTLGASKLSKDVNVLDVATTSASETGAYAKVYLSRIDGLEIPASKVAYFSKNSSGEISELYLVNVTGDMYDYGVAYSAETTKGGALKGFSVMSNWASYKYDGGAVAGKNITIGGGVGVITDGGNVKGFISTQQLAGQIKGISGGIVTTNAGEFKLDGNASAFIEASGYSYMQTTVSEVSDLTKYTVRAYYDKAEDKGGRIRVLVAALK